MTRSVQIRVPTNNGCVCVKLDSNTTAEDARTTHPFIYQFFISCQSVSLGYYGKHSFKLTSAPVLKTTCVCVCERSENEQKDHAVFVTWCSFDVYSSCCCVSINNLPVSWIDHPSAQHMQGNYFSPSIQTLLCILSNYLLKAAWNVAWLRLAKLVLDSDRLELRASVFTHQLSLSCSLPVQILRFHFIKV